MIFKFYCPNCDNLLEIQFYNDEIEAIHCECGIIWGITKPINTLKKEDNDRMTFKLLIKKLELK
jgi:hypothetical protein